MKEDTKDESIVNKDLQNENIANKQLQDVLKNKVSEKEEPTKWLLKYHDDYRVSTHANVVTFGNVEETAYEPDTNEAMVIPKGAVDEFTFYYLYCTINNIIANKSIADTQLLVLSAIMAKPLNFSLPIDSKDGKLTDIAKQLSTEEKKRTPNAIYQSVKRLRDSGYLVETEDRLIVPNANFQRVRQIVKSQIRQKGYATFDYLFKCYISNEI